MKRLLAVLLVAAGAAHSAEHEFDRVVNAIEKHYGVKRTHIPLMGLANFIVKVAHPAGTSGFKLAVFEDLSAPARDDDQAELDRVMNEICHGHLHPMVVTRSQRDGEATYILTGEIGKNTEVLIANFERHEATVIEAQVDIETLVKMMGSPGDAHRLFRQDSSDDGR